MKKYLLAATLAFVLAAPAICHAEARDAEDQRFNQRKVEQQSDFHAHLKARDQREQQEISVEQGKDPRKAHEMRERYDARRREEIEREHAKIHHEVKDYHHDERHEHRVDRKDDDDKRHDGDDHR